MTNQKMQLPSVESVKSYIRDERRFAYFLAVFFLVVGILAGNVMGHFDVDVIEYFSRVDSDASGSAE